MKQYFILFITLFTFTTLFAGNNLEIIDWSHAGNQFEIPKNVKLITLNNVGAKPNQPSFDNSVIFQNAIKSLNGEFGVIELEAGTYHFKKPISIPSNILIKGKGSDKTILDFNLGGNGDLISIQGKTSNISTNITQEIKKGTNTITVADAAAFKTDDYVLVKQSANNLLYSNWAYNHFYQIERIIQIKGNTITLEHAVRLDYPKSNNPILQKITPTQNVGIESLTIKRNDATYGQTSNIYFNYAVNCWVKGVESINSNYAHILVQSAANITISGNYIHDAFDYGSGGKGYGVVLQFGASNNFVYDNIAQHLRHSFLLQAEANGNVLAYNYSYNPYWTGTWLPSSSAGDIVLHGNYPYANLFEGNIVQNIVIDNSHGINGPDNTFFRNRVENYGMVMNGNSGDNMHFIANEITGSGLLKGMLTLNGKQQEIANNVKGSLQSGTVKETSLINKNYHAKIGTPNTYNSWKNEAYLRNNKTVKTIVVADKTNIIKQATTTVEPTKTAVTKETTKTKKKKCIRKRKKKK